MKVFQHVSFSDKELVACKERQEIELDAQRQTLDDQRDHIQILDKALNNAQERNLRLEEDVRKFHIYCVLCS